MKRVSLTTWIMIALVAGIAFGAVFPAQAVGLAILGTIFLRLIKSIIAPLLFGTLVSGIAGAGNVKTMGRIGGKAILYFEIVTTVALFVGLGAVNLIKPGAGVQLQKGAAPGVAQSSASSLADSRTHFPHQHHRFHGQRRSAADRRLRVHLRRGLRQQSERKRGPSCNSASRSPK